MFTRSYITILIIAGLSACNQKTADETQSAAPEPVPASLSAPFIGKWQIARPVGDSVLVNVPSVSCENPVIITSGGEEAITHKTPKSEVMPLGLMAFNGRITWMPDDRTNPYTFIAETKTPDTFWLYTVYVGKADWDNPVEYTRCP